MKSLVAVLVLACAAAGAATPAPRETPHLRLVLQQYDRAATPPPPPRQLSPGERAELRRQLSEQGKPARRR